MARAPTSDPHARLRDDVRLLGTMLGDTVRADAGDEAFALVERVRAATKAGRRGDLEAARAVEAALMGLPVSEAVPIARAFSQFLMLANIAEQHHRIRRRRDYARDPEAGAQRGSLDDLFVRLSSAGVEANAIAAALGDLSIEMVLTAHPTEITRRTLLAKQQTVARWLEANDHTDLTPGERGDVEAALRREVEAIWFTDELHEARPTPEDEARGGFAFVEKVLWDAVPHFLRRLDERLEAHGMVGLPDSAAPMRFGSWMGGDRDGNPFVTAGVTERVVWLARWMAAELYLRDIDALRAELSMRHASPDLLEVTENDPEPYRAVLRGLRNRLRDTLADLEARLDGAPVPEGNPIRSREDLEEPLRLVRDSLEACGMRHLAKGRILDTLRRLAAFGVHLVRLDIRQDAGRHMDAIAAVAAAFGEGDVRAMDEADRQDLLTRWLTEGRTLPKKLDASPEVQEVIETMRVVARQPTDALGAYVISMAKRPSDVLAVTWLQRVCGVRKLLPVVPLFETHDDLESAGATLDALLHCVPFRASAGTEVQVMIGYSDSAKDVGVLAAAWALYRAQEDLVRVAKGHGVRLTIFHGRGGSVGRGGGPAHAAIASLPPGAVAGRLRITEQGEVIMARFGLPGIAQRTLELYVTGVLEATLTPPAAPPDHWRETMDAMADAARAAYRAVLTDPGFVPYFRAATPEAELGMLNIGSRPARRAGAGGLESLRAIPWVFAWMQNRLLLPAWLGVGDGLKAAGTDVQALREMVDGWSFLRTTLDLVEMGCAKADPWVSSRYDAALVPGDLAPLGDRLRADLQKTVDALQVATGHESLLASNPVLRRSIAVRNPYVDPLNLLQVEFLRRLRAERDVDLERALRVTMNGVAQGMRNTG